MYPLLPSCPAMIVPIVSFSFSARKQVYGFLFKKRFIPSSESSMLFNPIPGVFCHSDNIDCQSDFLMRLIFMSSCIFFSVLIQPHLKSFLRTSAEANMFIERMRFRPLHTALQNHLVAVVFFCNLNGFLDHLFSKSLLPLIFVSNNIFYEAYRTAAFCQVWNYGEITCRDNFSIINGTDILYIFIRFNFIPDIPGFLQTDVRIIFIKLNVSFYHRC